MAVPVIMPQQGNTVESCLILEWKKKPGETVSQGEVVCEVETDKATFEVESPEAGTLLAQFFQEGDDVPVLTNIAAIGEKGEDFSSLSPAAEGQAVQGGTSTVATVSPASEVAASSPETPVAAGTAVELPKPGGRLAISPRAKRLAEKSGVTLEQLAGNLSGTGPRGRIIERDVRQFLDTRQAAAPAASEAVPTGIIVSPAAAEPGEITEKRLIGIRKLIADRMLASVQETAQLTLNAGAEATAVLDYRRKLKTAGKAADSADPALEKITINHIVLFAVSRTLRGFPELNAVMQGDLVRQYGDIHLAFAVDTPRGLMVPVIRNAHLLSLKGMAEQANRMADACQGGSINPDLLQGGTFTVTNLGHLGVESFTPILNPPQVGILGVGSIQLKPVQREEDIVFRPHLGLSLTINHQVVDGAPAARFLKALCDGLARFELLLVG